VSSPMSYAAFKAPAKTKAIQKRPLSANEPVRNGPELWLIVLTVFTMPITAVRSSGNTTAERKALLGAWSMALRLARETRRVMVSQSDVGNGMSERNIALGKWVNTIVLTKPIRFAMADAKRLPMLETNCADAMMLPSWPSGRLNFLDRKKAMSELGHMPLASESKKNREQSFSSVFRDFGDILDIDDDFFGGAAA
jgi:hypothetical protein